MIAHCQIQRHCLLTKGRFIEKVIFLKARVAQRAYSAKIHSGSLKNENPFVKYFKTPLLSKAGGTEGSFCKDQQVIFEE